MVRAYGEPGVEPPADGRGLKEAPFEDVTVRLKDDEPATFRIATSFRPVKVVVDPEVRVLFAGRKRCEKSL